MTAMLLLLFSIYFSAFCCFVGVGRVGEWYFRSPPRSLGPGSSRRAVTCWHTRRQESLVVHLGLMGDTYGQTAWRLGRNHHAPWRRWHCDGHDGEDAVQEEKNDLLWGSTTFPIAKGGRSSVHWERVLAPIWKFPGQESLLPRALYTVPPWISVLPTQVLSILNLTQKLKPLLHIFPRSLVPYQSYSSFCHEKTMLWTSVPQ